jgi:hypothetical protein
MASQKSKDWVKLVPLCTWLMNSQINTSTGYSPSELFFGRPVWQPELVPDPDANPNVQSWIKDQMSLQESARERLKKLRESQLRRANKGRQSAAYVVNDYVLVNRKRFPQWTTPKLGSQWFGPYTVIQVKHSAVIVRASPKLGGEVEFAFECLKHFPNQVEEAEEEEDDREIEAELSRQDEAKEPEQPPEEKEEEEEGM